MILFKKLQPKFSIFHMCSITDSFVSLSTARSMCPPSLAVFSWCCGMRVPLYTPAWCSWGQLTVPSPVILKWSLDQCGSSYPWEALFSITFQFPYCSLDCHAANYSLPSSVLSELLLASFVQYQGCSSQTGASGAESAVGLWKLETVRVNTLNKANLWQETSFLSWIWVLFNFFIILSLWDPDLHICLLELL